MIGSEDRTGSVCDLCWLHDKLGCLKGGKRLACSKQVQHLCQLDKSTSGISFEEHVFSHDFLGHSIQCNVVVGHIHIIAK